MLKLGVYRHYKNNNYRVIDTAVHADTHEPYVVYRQLYGEELLCIRPLEEFQEEVEINGERIPRFRYIGE